MKIILHKNKLKKLIQNEKSLGFVPTMGSIHAGHLYLIKKSISQSNKTVVSIFVNRGQFNRKADYLSYPRVLKKDISIIKKLKIDYLFLPTNKQIYPNGVNNKIKITSFSKKLCGKNRPGHFKSVVDVIDRFLKIINPKYIFLGQKDFQQVKVIEDYILKNKIKTKVIECKTVREKNGIAYSSRNSLLSYKEKDIGSEIYKILLKNKKYIIKKKVLISKIKKKIFNLGVHKIDYIKVLNVNNILYRRKKNKKYRIFIAYYLGDTRLIDNI